MTTTSHTRARAARAATLVAIGLLLGALVPAQAIAQSARSGDGLGTSQAPRRNDSRVSLRGSLGMTASPETFNMTLEVPWAADALVSAGPLFQLGFSDDDTLFATTVQAYLTPRFDGELDDWRPYAHMGMGFMYLEKDDRRPGRDDEDVDFLFTVGTGVEYAVSDGFYLGTGLLFDVIPTKVVGDRFVFGWQILTFRTEF